MQLTTREAENIFIKLNIRSKRCKHHVAGWFVYKGKLLFPVHYSFGRKDMPGNIPQKFRKSLHMSIKDFEELRRCHMSLETYIKTLKNTGELDSVETELLIDEMTPQLKTNKKSYEHIYKWYSKNLTEVYGIFPQDDKYLINSVSLIKSLPKPNAATENDILAIAKEVLTGLLEWAYHKKDESGTSLHSYARIIVGDAGIPRSIQPDDPNLLSVLRKFYTHST